MAKPRIFVSSTYYDLKYIRSDLERFIQNYGFEPILFERGQVAFDHQKPLDLSCYKEVKSSQMLILIIGGRYGSASSESTQKKQDDTFFEWYNSITRVEYQTAIEEQIPTYIFIEKYVHNEYLTYRMNKNNDNFKSAHVDTTNIFKFIEEIHNQYNNNIICDFENFDDIQNWLKNQWAGLFYDFLTDKKQIRDIGSLSDKIFDLGNMTDTLKNYLEKLLDTSNIEDAKGIISEEKERLQKVRDSKIKSKIMDSPMMKYMYQQSRLDIDDIYEAFYATSNLKEFLQKIKLKQKEMDYILSEPTAETNYMEHKNMLNN